MWSWGARGAAADAAIDSALAKPSPDHLSTNQAAREAGFDTAQLHTLRQVAGAEGCIIVARPTNPVTNLTTMVAATQGHRVREDGTREEVTVTFKPMNIKAKSGGMGGAIAEGMPYKGATAASRDAAAGLPDDLAKHNLAVQKSAELGHQPAVCALDMLHMLRNIGRLGNPYVEVADTTLESSFNDTSATSRNYYLVYPFSKTFASSKTTSIRVSIPVIWVHPDIIEDAESLAQSRPMHVKYRQTVVVTDHFDHHQEQIDRAAAYLAEVAAGKHADTTGLSQRPPASIFSLHKVGLIDESGNPIDKASCTAQWLDAFRRAPVLQRLLARTLFTAAPEARANPIPSALLPGTVRPSKPSGAYLTEAAQGTWLPAHVAMARDAATRPWPAAAGIKRALRAADGTRITALLASDLDLAAILYSTAPDGKPGDLAQFSDGSITGIGLPADARTLQAINAAYHEQLTHLGSAADLEGQMYRRQVAAGILAAHHGAENMNPYATVESTKAAMDEGFLFVMPDGHMQFLQGPAAIYQFLVAHCNGKAGDFHLTVSPVWYAVLQQQAAAKGETLPDNITAVDISEYGPKPSKEDPFAAVAKLKAKAIEEMDQGVFLPWSCATTSDDEAAEIDWTDRLLMGPLAVAGEAVRWAASGHTVSLPPHWHAVVVEHLSTFDIDETIQSRIAADSTATEFTVAGVHIDYRRVRRSSEQSQGRAPSVAGSDDAPAAAAAASASSSLSQGHAEQHTIAGQLIYEIMSHIAAADYPGYEASDLTTFASFVAETLGLTVVSPDDINITAEYPLIDEIDRDDAAAGFTTWYHTVTTAEAVASEDDDIAAAVGIDADADADADATPQTPILSQAAIPQDDETSHTMTAATALVLAPLTDNEQLRLILPTILDTALGNDDAEERFRSFLSHFMPEEATESPQIDWSKASWAYTPEESRQDAQVLLKQWEDWMADEDEEEAIADAAMA